jgi:hypothetical protein
MPNRKEDRYKQLFLYLVGAGFIIAGLNSIIRTYCTTLSDTTIRHVLIHECLLLTAPTAYLSSIIMVLIGIALLFIDRIAKWLAG